MKNCFRSNSFFALSPTTLYLFGFDTVKCTLIHEELLVNHQSIVFSPASPSIPRCHESVGAMAIIIVVATFIIVINPRSSIDTKYPHSIHNRQFRHHLEDPQEDICDANSIRVIWKVTSSITQHGGDDEEGAFDVEDSRPAFQLFPQCHRSQFPMLIENTSLQPMYIDCCNQTMNGVGDCPTPM